MTIWSKFLVLFQLFVISTLYANPINFSFVDLQGKNRQFSEFRGKWVIAAYFSPYCQSCVSEIPIFKLVSSRYHNTVVLGLDANETPENELKKFVSKHAINYTVIPSQDSCFFAFGTFYAVPTTFIVSPKGEVVKEHVGEVTIELLRTYIDANN